MTTATAQLIKGKKVLLRFDMDVPLKKSSVVSLPDSASLRQAGYQSSESLIADSEASLKADDSLKWEVADSLRLKAGMATLKLCLENAEHTTIFGHIGRPEGKVDPSLSVKPVAEWIKAYAKSHQFPKAPLDILENLRFEEGEDGSYAEFAMELAHMGDFFINEAFAAHHEAASTTLLPTMLSHAACLNFSKEVKMITGVREHPKKPVIAIIGGTKTEDKYPAIIELAKFCEAVLVGGKLPEEIKDQHLAVPPNVMLGKMSKSGLDLAPETIEAFAGVLANVKQIIWAGPVGKYEDPEGSRGNLELAKAAIKSGAETIIGGGDTTAALDFYLDKFSHVSTGGGAMLELLVKGTLPTIQALR